MALKCKIRMGDKVAPVDGSVKGVPGKETGTCPECETPGVMLSVVGGFVRAHVIATTEIAANNPQAGTVADKPVKKAGKALTEPVVELTDTGVRVGDPRAAEGRRLIELESAAGRGTVKVPRRGEKGRMKLVDVTASEENVRASLEYWRTLKLRVPKSGDHAALARYQARGAAQSEMVSELVRRLEAILAVQEYRYDESARAFEIVTVADLGQHAMVDTAQAHRGPTLVRGGNGTPRRRDPELDWNVSTDLRANGDVRGRSTLDQPLGRERFDKMITTVPEPPRILTRAQKRNRRRKVAREAFIARLIQQGAR